MDVKKEVENTLAWIPTDYGFPNNETNKSVLQGAFQPR